MKITIVQPETIWEDKAANIRNIEKMICKHFGETDIIVLPEMFATGFTLNAEPFAEEKSGDTCKWMTNLSRKGNFAICGTLIIQSDGKFYNHFSFITPQNENFTYDKRHLFSLGGENEIYTCGIRREIFEYKAFRFLPLICYDLRFPVWSRNLGDYDVMICVASWPDVRREAWNSLLKARAIENQCFVVGVNNTGKDKSGFKYAGDSVILDPLGKVMGRVIDYKEGSATADISPSELQDFRKKLPFLKDADSFSIEI
jgi:predicted amidohydrolase